uniref:Uncharacterized protein n=1 Tax=Octopus bimaculoides TaxID=37653 RepID=A0A0L8GRI6_OCTBM
MLLNAKRALLLPYRVCVCIYIYIYIYIHTYTHAHNQVSSEFMKSVIPVKYL